MKASCIIPVYNAEKTLRRCVESIVYGEERDLEVILVEDCSKDSSWELCRQLSSEFPNVHSFRNPENSGVSYTRNHGLQEACGDYILFVDSDDWVSGRYAAELLAAAKEYPEWITACGYHYFDECANTKTIYAFDDGAPVSLVEPKDYFRLVDRVLIQSLWNKVFRRDIIVHHAIRFDKSQSMGEDFQFVLDYLRHAGPKGFYILNKPLYFYIRANGTSLMSKLGVSGYELCVDRLKQLAELGGIESENLNGEIQKQKQCSLYFISRYQGYDKKEKLREIEKVMEDGKAGYHYAAQKKIQLAEKIISLKNQMSRLPVRISGKIQRKKRTKIVEDMRNKLTSEGFSLISQNCIGGVVYHDMKMQFLSPTINLYFTAADFSKFVLHLHEYLDMDLEMQWKEEYPVGRLGDLTVYFQHYSSCTEARDAWNRRKSRINWNKIIVLSTDHEGFHEQLFEKWKEIPYRKLLFTANPQFAGNSDVLFFPAYESQGCVPDLIPDREFYREDALLKVLNGQ